MSQQSNNGLVVSIVFAAVAISGSLVFFATQVGGGSEFSTDDLKAEIRSGIDSYVDEQTANNGQGEAEARPTPTVVDDLDDLVDGDPYIGDKDAPVTIVEFSDYQCPFCRSFYNGAYQDIKSEYIDTGKVKLVFRDFPLSFHQDAYPTALAAECVRDQSDDGKYFEFHDKVFEGQSGGGTVPISEDNLRDYVSQLGLDLDEFNECFADEKFKTEIYADQSAGQKNGITGTPGFIIDGKVVSGAQPFSSFEAVIEAALAK